MQSVQGVPLTSNSGLGPVSRKSRKLFGPEEPFVRLRSAYSVKLIFSYVVKGIKIKITAKFRASRRLRFEDTKRIMSPEMRPKSFGTFEKQAPGLFFSLVFTRGRRGVSTPRCSLNGLGAHSFSLLPLTSYIDEYFQRNSFLLQFFEVFFHFIWSTHARLAFLFFIKHCLVFAEWWTMIFFLRWTMVAVP